MESRGRVLSKPLTQSCGVQVMLAAEVSLTQIPAGKATEKGFALLWGSAISTGLIFHTPADNSPRRF
jgi:hypothetical protein